MFGRKKEEKRRPVPRHLHIHHHNHTQQVLARIIDETRQDRETKRGRKKKKKKKKEKKKGQNVEERSKRHNGEQKQVYRAIPNECLPP